MEPESTMTVKAAEAFAAYVAMGPGRSLRSLAHVLAEQNHYKTASTAQRILADWSVRYRWQERLSAAITARTEDALAKAAEIDAQVFLGTREELSKRMAYADMLPLDAIIKVVEATRKPEPRGATQVNVNLSVTLRAIVERIAAEQGLDADEVLAEAERILEDGG